MNLWMHKVIYNYYKFFFHDNIGIIDLFFITPGKFKQYQWIFQISWILPIIGTYVGIKKYWVKQWNSKSNEVAIFTLTILLFSYYLFLHSVFFNGENRYRMPVHFIMLALAGAGFWHVLVKTKDIVITIVKRADLKL